MNSITEGDSEVDSGTAVVRSWVDIADTWINIAKELPGLPRPNAEIVGVQLALSFPDGVPTITHSAI
jgi:hypothetical protein